MFRFFEGLVNPFPPEPPVQPPKGIVAFCKHYTEGITPYVILMASLTACLAVGEAFLFGILGQIVDWLGINDRSTFFDEQWPKLLGMSLFVLVGMPTIVWFHALVVHQALLGNYPMSIRWRAHRYLLGQSYSFFQNEFSGRVATKVMQTSLAVREAVMKVLDVLLFASVYLITAILLLGNADFRMSLPLFVWFGLYIVILWYFLPRLKSVAEAQADARSVMTGRIVDSYTNILTIKLFSHSKRESDYAQEGMEDFLNTVHPQMRLVTALRFCIWVLNMMLVFSIGALGIWLWMNSAITTGAIAIAMSIAIRLTGLSHWIMWEVSGLFENIGTVVDGMNTLSRPHAVVDESNAKALTISNGDIHLKDVSFSYAGENSSSGQLIDPVFMGLNLHIKAGEKIGVVGRSGAGKSSLVNLLLRFYDIQRGQICIDDQNIRSVTQDSLHGCIGMVTQDTSLLHRSVRENIKFGRPDASDEDMMQAAKRAHAHEFIQSLADSAGRTGYDAHVGERGVKLSGGQRQRIAIARVLLKDAPILILDEATSALDSEVEASIQGSLNELMEGKTVIAIAHRLSTIAALDRLIVFDDGRIVEQGTHPQLVEKGGLYAQLWAHQSGGFLGNV
ncbi:ABC transporter ATP-binding protein [Marinibactrum halimedae]|uniref:Multidrug ABC transporter ATP-binding protein n=1 Tax=Marinibactrum halimedae TaxID=1444977 RepID=A0AA37WN90_9GAMM|nr:ABC transporter ATP-binding protein [Marinibactrum halimedae]MCD9459125.1 ABC transporter ATP-binding protein/permease [Marinibactrum halimedae]GLS24727.1 multidrug ABC transporter ATP-binding protein [Marinibactrum halimedae]